jgi:hypothetical protein
MEVCMKEELYLEMYHSQPMEAIVDPIKSEGF